jgi:hypothetical protein
VKIVNKINLGRLFYTINIFNILILSLIIIECVKSDKKDMQREEVALEFNCDSLIHHSKLFVPEAGKPGGTLLLPTYSEPVSFNPIVKEFNGLIP